MVALGGANFNDTTPTYSDSGSHTWTTGATTSGSITASIGHNLNITGSGSHTFTLDGAGGFNYIVAAEFSGQDTAGLDDQDGAAYTADTTPTTPTVTTSVADELILTTLATDSTISGAITEDTAGGWTLLQELEDGAVATAGSFVYRIVGVAGDYSHTWTVDANHDDGVMRIATFKPSTPSRQRTLIGVGR